MTIDERIEALTMNLELAWRDITGMHENMALLNERTANLVRSMEEMVNIVRSHERRLTHLEGGEQ